METQKVRYVTGGGVCSQVLYQIRGAQRQLTAACAEEARWRQPQTATGLTNRWPRAPLLGLFSPRTKWTSMGTQAFSSGSAVLDMRRLAQGRPAGGHMQMPNGQQSRFMFACEQGRPAGSSRRLCTSRVGQIPAACGFCAAGRRFATLPGSIGPPLPLLGAARGRGGRLADRRRLVLVRTPGIPKRSAGRDSLRRGPREELGCLRCGLLRSWSAAAAAAAAVAAG